MFESNTFVFCASGMELLHTGENHRTDSDASENAIPSMAMIKEKQRDKCSNVNKKVKTNGSSSVTNSNGVLKTDVLENDFEIKGDSFSISDDMEKVSNNSPVPVACAFADSKGFAMDMCPVDNPCDGILPSVPMSMGSSGPGIDGAQPVPGSVVNKQPSTMEAQYMQQQSQVFVFSTEMANKSAESVLKGHYRSIIAYHCAQPKTKKFLERNPSRMNHLNRQNSNQWMNNFGPMKHKTMGMGTHCNVDRGGFRNNPMMVPDTLNCGPGGPPPGSMNMPPRLPMWNQQGNMNPMNVNNNNQHGPMMTPMCNNMMPGGPGSGPMPSSINAVLPGPMGPNPSGMMHGGMPMKCQPPSSSMDMISDSNSPNPLNVIPQLGNFPDDQFPLSPRTTTSLTGTKVPDEDLTPQQRLQREDKMATLRRIGEMLLPGNQQNPSHDPMNAEKGTSAHNSISVDDISSVLGGNDSTDMQMQKTASNSGAGGVGSCPGGPNSDWSKMQQPSFFDDRKRVPEVGGRCSSARSQGPPPPYHTTTRSASVPIAVPSPNPNSPGNATSNLSLPSPRTCSGMNSPASKQGPGPSPTTATNQQLNTSIESPSGQSSHGGGRGVNISNPGTPVSSGMHLSPNSKQKDGNNKMCNQPLPSEFSPAASGQQSPDSIFTRSLQNLARQQHQKPQQLPHPQSMQSANSHCKEPNLMPVPSPQHIQYLSTFEGQELTIQKQPNTSLKDTPSIVSPSLSSAGLDSMIPTSSDSSCPKVSVSAPNTPLTPSSLDIASSKYPGTPGDFSALSPSSGGPDNKSHMRGIANPSNQLKNDLRFPCGSPQLSDQSPQLQPQPQQQQSQQQQQRFQPTTTSFMSQTNKNTFLDVTSPDKVSCMGPSEPKDPNSCSNPNFLRILPNNVNVPIDSTAAPKPTNDPLSSLTQMSQLISAPGPPASQVGMMHSGMMSYNAGGHMPPNNMNMMPMPMNEMTMCGNQSNEPPPSSMADGSRMVFNTQMPPGMSMRMGGGGPVVSRMMPCPNPNDGGGGGGPGGGGPMGMPKPGMPPGPYPMMASNARMIRSAAVPLNNSYNGANIQVKPNAPNTIQYLPNRTQSVNMGARGPPSLEFLRYQNPNAMPPNMEKQMQPPPPHGMNYFPNNYAGGPGNPMNEMMAANMNCGMPPGNPMVRGPSMRGSVNPQGPPQPPPNMMRMGGGNVGGAGPGQMGMPPFNEQMYQPGGGGGGPGPGGPGPNGPNPNMPNNCHMFMGPNQGPPKMVGMGMGGGMPPDATQPLPPSMAQPNNFKNAAFMNSNLNEMENSHFQTNFYQFQQQLYATNPRNQVNSQPMTAPSEQYYVPK